MVVAARHPLQQIQTLCRDAALLEAIGTDSAHLAAPAPMPAINLPAAPTGPVPSLADRFVVPPFTVLDARQGYWQDRKRQWLGVGIQSEIGRGGMAAEKAVAAGFTGVIERMEGGFLAWAAHGFDSEPG